MKTILIVTIEHAKPLPTRIDLTDLAAERVQNYLLANNCPSDVTATRCTEHDRPLRRWEIEHGQPA